MSSTTEQRALVLLSGGQDSTTCLYWALDRFSEVSAICFDYGQRHRIELESAQKIADLAQVSLTCLPIDTFSALGGNALTGSEAVSEDTSSKSLPNTFVPGRNLIFLTFAAAYAYQHNIPNLVTGTCETDYSGYPDCRRNTLDALQLAINLGMESQLTLHTPLMWLSKAETVLLAQQLGALEALGLSHTCYNGSRPPCQQCPACQLRAKGFAEAGITDPLDR